MHVQPGDKVCVLYGGRTPFVLRLIEGSGLYHLLGESCESFEYPYYKITEMSLIRIMLKLLKESCTGKR